MLAWLKLKLKLSHHEHTGRLRPHEYTSYGPLAIVMVAVGLALLGCTVSASTPYNGPEAGSVGLSGTVPKAAPKVAATIGVPTDNQHFTTSPITVSGTCPNETLVEIYKNDIFAGSGPCDSNGSYSFKIDLLVGKNVLVARVYDVLNQPGPDSNSVTVYYDALPPQSAPVSSLNFSAAQLVLNTDAVYRGVFPDHELSMPIEILGGVPPYALNIQWGDSSNSVISRSDNLTFQATHTYHKAGTYQVTLQASDAQGRVAYLTVVVIVNGQPAVTSVSNVSKGPVNKLLVLWPLYVIAATMVVSFWLGERREKHILEHAATLGPVYR